MKSKLLRIALVLSLVLAAAVAGYVWLGRNNSTEQRLAESYKRSQYVLERYFSAEESSAKQEMLEHISYLDRLSRESSDQTRNPYAFDAMVWYARLAKLEERENSPNSAEYMREAAARCQRLERGECSEKSIRQSVERMDSVALAMLNKQ